MAGRITVLETLERCTTKPMPPVSWGQASQERRAKMKRVMIVLAGLFVFNISAFAQMSTGRGGGMMGGGWGWGMNSGWFIVIIIAILVIFGIAYLMKRK
jgi:thiol:disulfide interchange protein